MLRVYRLDIGINIELDHPVEQYLQFFHTSRFFNKSNNHEGIDYHNQDYLDIENSSSLANGKRYSSKKRSFIIYDKLKELRNKEIPVSSVYEGRNIIRLEYQLQSDIKSYLKIKGICPHALEWPIFRTVIREVEDRV